MSTTDITAFIEHQSIRRAPRTLAKYRHDWSRFQRVGQCFADEWRVAATRAGMTPKTIESTLSTVKLIHRFYDLPWDTGTPLSIPQPFPDVPPVGDIGRFYAHSAVARWPSWLGDHQRLTWWQTFTVVGAWTGFRLGDLERLTWAPDAERLRMTASKTAKRIEVPILSFVSRHLNAISVGSFQLTRSRHQMYREFRRISSAARVRYISPQSLRRFAINQWSTADSNAGTLIHGKSLGVLDYYLDTYRVLLSATHRVEMPDEFFTDDERQRRRDEETELISRYRMASSERKRVILDVTRMA